MKKIKCCNNCRFSVFIYLKNKVMCGNGLSIFEKFPDMYKKLPKKNICYKWRHIEEDEIPSII